MLTSILIDVDGTLVDTKNIFYSSLNQTLCKFHIAETNDAKLFGMSVDQALNKLGLDNNNEIKKEWEAAFGDLSIKAGFYDNIVSMAQKLSENNIRIIVITSRSHITADPIKEDSELGPYICGCIAAEDTKMHKPDPAPILKAIELYGIEADKTIYIGDTYEDYQAAMNADIPFALAGWNSNAKAGDYQLVLNSPLDVVKMAIGG